MTTIQREKSSDYVNITLPSKMCKGCTKI